MAGHVIATYLNEQGYDITTLSNRNKYNNDTVQLDVTDKEKLDIFLKKNKFDYVINCIGMLIKASEERKDLAVLINAYLPHFLEEIYRQSSTKIIHLSTDCVFSGKNPPYKEASIPDGELFYDRSKSLGEIINDKDLTFRMSIIGPDMQENGIGLFNWFMSQKGTVSGYTRAIWNGITTIELAKAINSAIEQNITGLYHLVPNENITKYELLKLFKETFEIKGMKIIKNDKVALDKTLINTRKDFDYKIPSYNKMILDMKDWIKSHKELYGSYKI